MKATDIPFKLWKEAEAKREGVSFGAIEMRISRGNYPQLVLNRINARVIRVAQSAGPEGPRLNLL